MFPSNQMKFWESRLVQAGVPAEKAGKRLREEVLVFADPDGLKLELVASVWNRGSHAWDETSVSVEHAIRGFHAVTLSEQGYERTAKLPDSMGFRKVGEEGAYFSLDD
jgi:glyoxalase family protein